MSNPENYFDNAAATPVDTTVLEEMLPYFGVEFGNASSIHSWGQRAKAATDLARERVAALLGCAPEEIFFTSGATESNNWVLQSFTEVAVSPFEHSSVWETAKALDYRILENDGYELEDHGESDLVSVMLVNNETGAKFDTPKTTAKIHRDITQALGKVPIDVARIDFASMSAHKLYGPKGVGALYIHGAEQLEPLHYGGEQESGLRAGTLNVPGIVGFGAACALAGQTMADDHIHAESLRETVLSTLAKVPDSQVNQHQANSPYILSVSFLGIEGETLAVEVDSMGFAISSGAACSSRSSEPSHVLTALGIEPEWLRGTVRLSFSRNNTLETAENLARALTDAVRNIRASGK